VEASKADDAFERRTNVKTAVNVVHPTDNSFLHDHPYSSVFKNLDPNELGTMSVDRLGGISFGDESERGVLQAVIDKQTEAWTACIQTHVGAPVAARWEARTKQYWRRQLAAVSMEVRTDRNIDIEPVASESSEPGDNALVYEMFRYIAGREAVTRYMTAQADRQIRYLLRSVLCD
jgi:hypothetical protein